MGPIESKTVDTGDRQLPSSGKSRFGVIGLHKLNRFCVTWILNSESQAGCPKPETGMRLDISM